MTFKTENQFPTNEKQFVKLIFSFHFFINKQYDHIWEIDEKDPLFGPEGGESVKDVASRLAKTMAIFEQEFEGYPFLPLNII